jgi:hypothetical protein
VTIDKGSYYSTKSIIWISYCVVIVNSLTLHALPNYDWYIYSFVIYYSTFFTPMGTNLGIPDNFTSLNGFDGNCLVGVYKLGIR